MLDRLTRVDYLGDPCDNEQFTYDNLGNRLTLNNRAGADIAYSHNIANEYTNIGGNSVSHDAPGNISVDADGYKYYYDYENRLTKVDDSGDAAVAAYHYDALGRRIEKITYDDGVADSTTHYYYDGWRVLSETDENGVNQRDYIYGNYLDEVLVKVEDSEDIYYAHDHLYSSVALINDSGNVVERYEYDVYGKRYVMDASYNSRSSSNYNNVIAFTGQRLDELDSNNLAVMYYKNRYYLVALGPQTVS